jgi:hypothetical protein
LYLARSSLRIRLILPALTPDRQFGPKTFTQADNFAERGYGCKFR